MHAMQEILPNSQIPQRSEHASSSKAAKLDLNFSDTPVPAEWKEGIIQKLSAMPEVFTLHDTDVGCTDKVNHQIKVKTEE